MNLLQMEQKAGRRLFKGLKAQVAIETSVAIVALFIFLLGVTQAFLWINRNIIARQRNYQATRTQMSIDFYQPSEFHVFPQER